jgi:hypothetical protein
MRFSSSALKPEEKDAEPGTSLPVMALHMTYRRGNDAGLNSKEETLRVGGSVLLVSHILGLGQPRLLSVQGQTLHRRGSADRHAQHDL